MITDQHLSPYSAVYSRLINCFDKFSDFKKMQLPGLYTTTTKKKKKKKKKKKIKQAADSRKMFELLKFK